MTDPGICGGCGDLDEHCYCDILDGETDDGEDHPEP